MLQLGICGIFLHLAMSLVVVECFPDLFSVQLFDGFRFLYRWAFSDSSGTVPTNSARSAFHSIRQICRGPQGIDNYSAVPVGSFRWSKGLKTKISENGHKK